MTVTSASFREAFARVPTAVSVITTADSSGQAWGVTVGSLCSLSLAPPLVLFCMDRDNSSHDVVTGTARFLIHVLMDDQAEVARWFARRDRHDFDGDHLTVHGLPSVPGPLALLACRQHALIPGGDHTIVIGLVEAAHVQAGRPLLYHQHDYCGLAEPPSAARALAARSAPALARLDRVSPALP